MNNYSRASSGIGWVCGSCWWFGGWCLSTSVASSAPMRSRLAPRSAFAYRSRRYRHHSSHIQLYLISKTTYVPRSINTPADLEKILPNVLHSTINKSVTQESHWIISSKHIHTHTSPQEFRENIYDSQRLQSKQSWIWLTNSFNDNHFEPLIILEIILLGYFLLPILKQFSGYFENICIFFFSKKN